MNTALLRSGPDQGVVRLRSNATRAPTRASILARHAGDAIGGKLLALVTHGCDRLPMPGQGDTLGRWRALAEVAGHDLALVKLFEGHTDALAILWELGVETASGERWATWAAEAPGGRVEVAPLDRSTVILTGRKCWCSGSASVDRALVTCWRGKVGPYLAAVNLRSPGITIEQTGWVAVGMGATASFPVRFANVPATLVGGPGDYLQRPGFWHGGAGIAACWYGGACAVANELAARIDDSSDTFKRCALGEIHATLSAAAALLRETAQWIDEHPSASAQAKAMCVRRSVERAAQAVLTHAGEALGASAYCLNARFARFAADLPVFLRQSHGPQDAAVLGGLVAEQETPWRL